MKKLLLVLTIGAFAACNEAPSTTDAQVDSSVQAVESAVEAVSDSAQAAIDSTANAANDSIDAKVEESTENK